MKITDYGRKQLDTNKVKAYLMTWVIEHLIANQMSEADVRDSLRLIISMFLCGTERWHRYVPTDLDDTDEFERENAEEIEKYVDRTMADALPGLNSFKAAL